MWSPVCEPPRRPRVRTVRPDRAVEPRAARRRRASSAGRAGSMPGPPERLVGEQVAEPRDARLVHQHRLHRRSAARHDVVEPRTGERERVGTEAALVGVELDRAEPARVAQRQRAAVGEPHAEAVPGRVLPVARVEKRVSGGLAVDDHPSAHPEVESERRARRRSCRRAGACPRRRRLDERATARARPSTARAVRPRLRNHASGASTDRIARSSARSSIRTRAVSTSRISGTFCSIAPQVGCATAGGRRWTLGRSAQGKLSSSCLACGVRHHGWEDACA